MSHARFEVYEVLVFQNGADATRVNFLQTSLINIDHLAIQLVKYVGNSGKCPRQDIWKRLVYDSRPSALSALRCGSSLPTMIVLVIPGVKQPLYWLHAGETGDSSVRLWYSTLPPGLMIDTARDLTMISDFKDGAHLENIVSASQ